MAITLTVPQEYGYVLLSGSATFFLAIWHQFRVGPFRKAAKIPYPHQYATANELSAATGDRKKAMYLFNCAQRAHYNFVENYITFLPAMLIAGLRYPVPAAIAGGLWSVFRVLYAVGYTRKDKDNGSGRLVGSAFWLVQFALYGMVGYAGYSLL